MTTSQDTDCQQAEGSPSPVGDESSAPAHRRGRRLGTVVVGLLLVGAATAGTTVVLRHRGAAPTTTAAPLRTDTVTRTDLRQYQQLEGTLGYAGSYLVTATHGSGVLTWLPELGTVVSRGQRLYDVDGVSVPLLYGPVPLWRDLDVGVDDGPDVKELKRNLKALAYGPDLADDSHYSRATADAVDRWQDARGLTATGAVAPGDAVVEPGAVRVTAVHGVLGGTASGSLLALSSTVRQVTVRMPVAEQQLATPGAAVVVALPGGATTGGRISWVDTVAHGGGGSDAPPESGSTGASGAVENATVQVGVSLDRAAAAGRLDGAPVTVSFTSAVRRGVLTVPVPALLALAGGGYAVQLVDAGGGTRLTRVRLGMFAQGRVEVSGAGIAVGQKVQVPGS
jgi:peptidoglycan hydrolase-like protein with peptidoglycan-binding domain